MKERWNKIKDNFSGLTGLTTIGVSDIVASAISAVFWLYLANLLGAENYGKISYFIAAASIASTFALIGARNTIIVYTAKEVKIQPPVYFITIICGFVAAIVLFFMFNNLGLSLYVLFTIFVELVTAEILGRKLYQSYSKYLIIQRILMITLAIGLYYILGINGVILGLALAYFPYVIRIYKEFRGSKIDFSILRPRMGFIVNSYILSLTSNFSGTIDKIIIAPFLGYTLLGNYQLGIQFLSILQILPGIVYKYTLPHDASGTQNQRLKKISIIISIGLAILGIFISPIVIPIIFPKYIEAIEVFQIVSLSVIPVTINYNYQSKFLGNEKSKIILINSGIYLAVQISTIVILGKMYGINGVAAAFVLASSTQTLFYFIVNKFNKKN